MPQLVGPCVPPGSVRGRDQPTFTVDELVVRPFTGADVPAVVAAYADPAVQQWHGQSMTHDEATAWVASQARRWDREDGAGWAVTDGRVLLGRVGLNKLDLAWGTAAAAYWVLPAERGRRVAPRSLDAVVRWALGDVGLQRVELEHSTRNEASCRVAGRAGFEVEGTRRLAGRHPDGWHDMHLHARLAPE